MGLSANTLFHFTEFSALKGILKNGFYPHCSIEQFAVSNDVFPIAIPMVSFCDIRLTQVHAHVSEYGKFGIGLSKEWGINKGVSPILYVNNNSFLREKLKSLINYAFKFISDKGTTAHNFDLKDKKEFEQLIQIIAYIKFNYTPKWDKSLDKFEQELKNFYDEREWRYYPTVNSALDNGYIALPFIPYLENDKFSRKEAVNKWNSICKSKPLTFKEEDIKYLIVDSDSDILELINYLKKNKLFNINQETLFTKITTIGRITEDH